VWYPGRMRFVFWDWNGTLVNDAPVLWRSFNDMVVPRGGSAVTFERYREMYRHPIRDMYAEVGVDLSQYPFESIASEWHERYDTLSVSMRLHHDALMALSLFQRQGSRQMVVSALPHDFLGSQVERFGVGHFFEHVRGIPDQLAHSKVEQAVDLASKLGAKGGDITVIGDSSHDAEVAKELEATCILVARGAESRGRLEGHGYQVLDDFSELVGSLSIGG
jgi:phosphoglycolate phosphatase